VVLQGWEQQNRWEEDACNQDRSMLLWSMAYRLELMVAVVESERQLVSQRHVLQRL